MNREQIKYCHWKSNIDLAQATAGEMDLDFLIDRESFQTTLAILSRLGFKPTQVRWGADTPGIAHFYGYDPYTGQFAHVHLFSRVLTGESFIKSHLLPFEGLLLDNIRFDGPMRVTSKAAELVLFTIRTFIKYGSPLDLIYLRKKAAKIKAELQWLKDGVDLSESLRLLAKYCPVIDEQLFLQCLETLENNASLGKRYRLARQVRSRIRGYAKHTTFEWLSALASLTTSQVQRRLETRKKKNKVFQAGGAIIAIVGADASGKSTVVAETKKWLSQNFLVRVVHAGKPPASLTTAPVNLALGLIQRLSPKTRINIKATRASSSGEQSSGRKKQLADLLFALRAVTLAWDRRNLLLKSWRDSAKGEVVLCDRYPSNFTGAMDSPRLAELSENTGWVASLYNRAARVEKRLYTQIPPPDIVIRLTVPVEVAIERNRQRRKPGGEPDKYIADRHRHSSDWRRTDMEKIFDIDTQRPQADTIFMVKEIIWRNV